MDQKPSVEWFETIEKEIIDIELILTSLARNETVRCTECGQIAGGKRLQGISTLPTCLCPGSEH